MANLVIPGIVTIIVTLITGYFALLGIKAQNVAKTASVTATNGAATATKKADELSAALDLLHGMGERLDKAELRLTKAEGERDQCRAELEAATKLISDQSEDLAEMRDTLGMTRRRQPKKS